MPGGIVGIGAIPEHISGYGGPDIPIPLKFDNLWTWLDASRITGVANGGNVSTWDDVSPRGENFSQVTDTNQPILTLGALNGLPVVTFSTDAGGNAKYLTNSTTLVLPVTIYAVARRTADTDDYHVVLGNGGVCDIGFEANAGGYAYAGSFLSVAAADASYHVISAELNGANSMIRANDTQVTGTIGAGTPDSVTYVGYLAAADLIGDVAEVIVYTDSQNSVEIDLITHYLLSKYGLST